MIDSKSEPYIQPSGLSEPNILLADLLPYRSPGPSVTDCLTTQFDFSSSKNVTHTMSSLDDTDPSENEDLCDLTFRSKGLHVANLNVMHLFSKLDELRIVLALENGPDIVGLCETFLGPSIADDLISIAGYDFFTKRQALHRR